MNPQWYFLIFQIFLEFSSTRLVGTKRNETIIFIFHISPPFPTYFGLKWTTTVFLLFFEFFTIFTEFSITLGLGTKRNDNSYFLSFPAFSNLFWLIMRPHWLFWIFLLFFWNFLLHIGQERNEIIIFFFLSFSASSNLFWLEMRQ